MNVSEPDMPCYLTEPKARQGSDSDLRVESKRKITHILNYTILNVILFDLYIVLLSQLNITNG